MLERDPLRDLEPLIERVYAYVCYRIGDGLAEDVVGDTFERAIRYRRTYDPAKGKPIAWLIGIARRCVQEASTQPAESHSEIPDVGTLSDLETEVALRLELEDAVKRLSDRERELIALRYGADLTSRQIADQLGMERNAVDVALHRALARLKALLERSEPLAGLPERQDRE